ncbi:hypothetical protein BQ1740_3842 [Bacillus subtilis]|nr:hypothetical protein BQ1740_3842 [Bacillus subtilis]
MHTIATVRQRAGFLQNLFFVFASLCYSYTRYLFLFSKAHMTKETLFYFREKM